MEKNNKKEVLKALRWIWCVNHAS